MRLRLLWMKVFCLIALCASMGIAQELRSTHMQSGERPDSLAEAQIRLNHAKTVCLIHEVGDKAELSGKIFRNNLTGIVHVGGDFSTQWRNQMITYSADTTLDNEFPVKIDSNLYLLVMEKKGDQIDIDGGILGVGTELRFGADKWTFFLGSQYRNGGCVIGSQGNQFFEGTEKRDETLGVQTKRPAAVANEPPDTIIAKYGLPGKFPSEIGKHSFKFELPKGGKVDISIIGPSGKKVRTLKFGQLEAGKHIIPWDGSDDSGNLVPLGMYFYQIRVDGKLFKQDQLMLRNPRN